MGRWEGGVPDMKDRVYLAVGLKSFYGSVECVERGLDPLTTNLVVVDKSRTEKTICLAVTPSLKAYGISGRARLFGGSAGGEGERPAAAEVPRAEAHWLLLARPGSKSPPGAGPGLLGSSAEDGPLIEWSTRIYNVYLKYAAPLFDVYHHF